MKKVYINNSGILPEMSDKELVSRKGETVFMDVEVYPNYFLIMFYFSDEQIVYFEGVDFNVDKLTYILSNFEIVTFNGNFYDIPVLKYFIYKRPTEYEIFTVGGWIINENMMPYQLFNKLNIPDVIRNYRINHIDLKEICIGQSGLKTYAGRINAPHLESLPYDPSTHLTDEQKERVLRYCQKDVVDTYLLYKDREPDINLRREMTIQYSADVRSKSDAQIAEVVIARELQWKHGVQISKTKRPEYYEWHYTAPVNIKFSTDQLNKVLEDVHNTTFQLQPNGSIKYFHGLENYTKTPWGGDRHLEFYGTKYSMGIGGLHSKEKNVSYKSNDKVVYLDRDVASYYPFIILKQGLYPKHLGKSFLTVYEGIVKRRLEAKHSGDKRTANTLKIVINGSFGKFGSVYSFLFSPELLIQTTVSGQLYLLMLIERLQLAGFQVVSANTDGLVTEVYRDRRDEFEAIVAQWEKDTQFETEETEYQSLNSRDVNNYIAVLSDGSTKSKGAFAHANIGKNPAGEIINDAVRDYLAKGIPVEDTITNCKDITKFLYLRKVNGGCIDADGNEVGSVVRYYYEKGQFGCLRYKTNQHKVPKSDGASTLMNLDVDSEPQIDYHRYIKEAKNIISSDLKSSEQLNLFA